MRYKVYTEDRCPKCGRTNCSQRTQRSRLTRIFCPDTKLMKCLLCHSQYLVRHATEHRARREVSFIG